MKPTFKYLLGFFLITSFAHAQVGFAVSTKAPLWGPAGYDNATYYYLPDVESYYDIRTRDYIYVSNSKWIRARKLPAAHQQYNLFKGYKVVLTEPGNMPFKHFKSHKVKYYKGYKGPAQKTIGNPPGRGNGKVGHPGYKGPKNKSHLNGHKGKDQNNKKHKHKD